MSNTVKLYAATRYVGSKDWIDTDYTVEEWGKLTDKEKDEITTELLYEIVEVWTDCE